MSEVLVVAPHMDDEVLGCGGVICRHKESGDTVSVVFVAHRVYDHRFDEERNRFEQACALKAKEVLGYDTAIFLDLPDERLDRALQEMIVPLERVVAELRPHTIYLPFRGDNNQDHRAVFDAARVAVRPAATPFVNNIYMYEVPSSTDQSPPMVETAFMPNFYVETVACFERKLKALTCYTTEMRSFPHPRSEEGLSVLARKRGMEIGFDFAEAFVVLRQKWGAE